MYENNFRLEGKVYARLDSVQVTENFRKREFVLEVMRPGQDMTVDLVRFQCVQSNIILLDDVREGNRVVVSFRVTGKEYNKDGKKIYFTNLDCTDIDISDNESTEEHTPGSFLAKDIKDEVIPANGFAEKEQTEDEKIIDEYDDLPF